MQKTKPVAKQQVPEFENVPQQMARYFEEHISAAELIDWITTISVGMNLKENDAAAEFIGHLGWLFLPELTMYTTPGKRFVYLKKEVPEIFRCVGYKGAKEAFAEIGASWLTSNGRLQGGLKGVSTFSRILRTFLCLAEMYSEYEADNAVAKN